MLHSFKLKTKSRLHKKAFCFYLSFVLLLAISNQSINAQFVKTNGTKLADENGNELFLTGLNLGNWLLWEGYLMMGDFNYRTHTQFFNSVKDAFGGDLAKAMEFEHQWRLNYVTEQAIIELKDRGFNSVRVPFHFNLFWDWSSNTVSDRGFQYFDRVIDYCRMHGLYVLLDMHAAPGYQNPGDHCDNLNSNASQPRESVTFWDENNINIASQVWRHIANYYKNEPVVWGYDLINEPVPKPGREFELLGSLVTLRNAIREVDNNHIIVAEGSWWGSDMQKLDWMDTETQNQSGINYRWDNKLVYQTHHYSSDVSLLSGRLAICNKLNVPMILGEYGESDMGNLRNMTDWCINNNVSYFPWSFKKMSHDKCLWTINPNSAYNSLKNYINSGGTPPANIYNDMIRFCQNNIANGAPGLTYHQDFYDAVKNNSIPPPSCTTHAVPGTIQAESYCTMNGIETENTSDAGGGENIGWIDPGDWMEYEIQVPSSGLYKIKYRVASQNGGGQLTFKSNGNSLSTSSISNTGGWQSWTTISATLNLSAGVQTIRIEANAGGWNINWFSITENSTTPTDPDFETVIQAEDYFEMYGVQTENTSDIGGGLNVGWTDGGDWMGYNINIPESETYMVEYRIASPNSSGQLSIEQFGGGTVFGTISIPNTGGWQNWQTISHNIQLPEGQQNIGILVNNGGWNINWIKISNSGLKSGATSPKSLLLEKSNSNIQLKAFPNPSTDILYISGLNEPALLKIYNLNGTKLHEDLGQSISISTLPRGVYVLKLENKSIQKQIKFLKN